MFAQNLETNPNYNAVNNWVIGNNIGMKWNKEFIHFDTTRKNWIQESSSSVSDNNGDLKFYSNGLQLYDNNDSSLLHDLKGSSSSTQGSLIANCGLNQFILLVTDFNNNPSPKLTYTSFVSTEFSFNINQLNKILLRNGTEKLTGGVLLNKHKTIIITHDKTDLFYTFIISNLSDIICPQISKKESTKMVKNAFGQGMIKQSFSGIKIAIAASNPQGFIEIFSFNRETGLVENLLYSLKSTDAYGLEFSPNEKYLYATLYNGDLIQIDIANKTSMKVGFTKPNTITGIQRGPDNKIYVARVKEPYLDAIEHPDSFGIACGFKQRAVNLPANVNFGLPNFNASYFYTPSIDYAYTEDCWEHTYSFEGRDTFDADGYKWIFSKGSYRDSKLTKNCVYQFADTGKWQVSHIAWNASRADTVTKTLTIRPKWEKDVLGKDTFYCKGNKASITLKAPVDMHCVHWGDNGPVEEPNLDETLGPIIDYDHFHTDTFLADTAGTYIVKLTNKTFCQMWDTITVSEFPNPQKPSIQRNDQELESSIIATEYRWYFNGSLKLTTNNSQLIPDSNGYWQVQLVSEYGCESALSDSFLVGFASVEELKPQALAFKVYPNPSDGRISIDVPKEGEYKILVADLNGKLVYSTLKNLSLLSEFELDLPNGTYIITITDDGGRMGSEKVEVIN
jgi:hypothetical protein